MSIPLTLSRGRNVPDPVTVTMEGLPTGVAPALLQFGVGESKAQLSVQAAGDAAQGAIHAKVRVTSGKSTSVQPIELFVRGAPGTLDTTFGKSGIVPTTIGDNQNNEARDFQIMADDSIVVLGNCKTTTIDNACLAKYSADGNRDTSYGPSGIVSLLADRFPANVVAIKDGKVLVLAGASLFGDGKTRIKRLNGDGSLDTTFGATGICDVSAGGAPLRLSYRSTDSAIFVQFQMSSGGIAGSGILKLNTSCVTDAGFGTAGVAYVGLDTASVPRGLVLRGGKVVVAAQVRAAGGGLAFAQVDGSTGALDQTFGAGGVQSFPSGVLTSAYPGYFGMTLAPTGAVIAGFLLDSGSFITSVDATGKSLTANFGTGGVHNFASGFPTEIARDGNGKLLVALPNGGVGYVLRLEANGSPDASFAAAGTFYDPRFRPQRVAFQRDGRLIVFGQQSANADMTLARLWN